MGQAEKTVKLWKKQYINSSPNVSYIFIGWCQNKSDFSIWIGFLDDSIAHVISWFNDFSR